jgi:hypothetical protein
MDVNEFSAYLGDFLDAYDKQSEKILGNFLAFGAWYEYLSANLADSELKSALQNALIVFEFLPSPKQVVEAFKGTKEAIALEEFQDCLDASKSGNSENLLLSPQGEKALRSVGGLSRLAREETENLYRFVQKDFVRLWQTYERALISGAIAPPPPKLKPVVEEKFKDLEVDDPVDWAVIKSKFNQLVQQKSME